MFARILDPGGGHFAIRLDGEFEASRARSAGARKTVGRQLAAAEVEKVRAEVARHAQFAAAIEQIAEVNEKICEARAVAGADAPSAPAGGKGGSSRRSPGRKLPI